MAKAVAGRLARREASQETSGLSPAEASPDSTPTEPDQAGTVLESQTELSRAEPWALGSSRAARRVRVGPRPAQPRPDPSPGLEERPRGQDRGLPTGPTAKVNSHDGTEVGSATAVCFSNDAN